MLKVGDKLLHKYNSKYSISDIFVDRIYFDNDDYYYYFLDSSFAYSYIWNYFYKPQELRKLKLKQLNDVKSR